MVSFLYINPNDKIVNYANHTGPVKSLNYNYQVYYSVCVYVFSFSLVTVVAFV